MIGYVIGALVAGAAIGVTIGIAIGGSRERRASQSPALAGGTPKPARPVPELTMPETTADATPSYADPEPPFPVPGALSEGIADRTESRQPDVPESHLAIMTTNLQVAEAVLEVADRLASKELTRRLGDALRPLDGVSILTPEVGADFEPHLHEWVGTRAVAEGHVARTIAATKVPGMTRDDDETVIRKARVIVFE
jgi:hypothetical protein